VQASSADDMAAGGFLSPDGSAKQEDDVSTRCNGGGRERGTGGGSDGAYQRGRGGEEGGGAGGRGLLGFGRRWRGCEYIGGLSC
jgi:hypothetical protein